MSAGVPFSEWLCGKRNIFGGSQDGNGNDDYISKKTSSCDSSSGSLYRSSDASGDDARNLGDALGAERSQRDINVR